MKKQFTTQETRVKNSFAYFLILLIFGSLNAFAQTGAAIKFDGAGDFIDLGPAITGSLNGGTSITIEAWVNTSTNSGNHGPIVGNYNTNNTGLSFLLRRENGHHVFWVGNGSIYPTVSLNTSSLNVWTHLACVWNGTVATIYVNGVQTASTAPALTAMQTNSMSNVYIGAAPITNEYFNGMIDEVRIWNVARTRCQINTYKNCEIPANAPGLMANYHFNQGIAGGNNTTVTTLTDATSSALTGTLAGLTLTGTTSNWVAPGGVVSDFTTAIAGPGYSATSLSTCAGNTISLSSTGATSFTWLPAITNGAAFTPTVSGSYTITNINSTTTCTNTSVAGVTVNALPTITISSSTSLLCLGQTETLTATGTATSYTWNTNATGTSISVSPTVTTSYTVTGTDSNGCTNKTEITQNVSLCAAINQTQNTVYEVVVFPNPSSTNITVQTNQKIQTISIYTSVGALVKMETSNTFSVEQLARALYILTVRTENGTTAVRFIKE